MGTNGLALGQQDEINRAYAPVICRHLSKVKEVDGLYALEADDGVIHIYTVVGEFESKIYDKLLPRERVIEKECPDIHFDFHVRAHQGREPALAVPFDSRVIFTR